MGQYEKHMVDFYKRFLPMWIDACKRLEETLLNDKLFIKEEENKNE